MVGRVKVELITSLLPPRSLLNPLLRSRVLRLFGARSELCWGLGAGAGHRWGQLQALWLGLRAGGDSRNTHAPGNQVTHPTVANSYTELTSPGSALTFLTSTAPKPKGGSRLLGVVWV